LVGRHIFGHELANSLFCVAPQPSWAGTILTAQFLDQPPIASRSPTECAFGHVMLLDERVDLAKDRVLFHERDILRVITRTSSGYAGLYTILRENTRALISAFMDGAPTIDMEKLRADMAEKVERSSARKFSLAATGGSNPDFYRNFLNNGQDKRLSADVFVGIVAALGRDPVEYIKGADVAMRLPSAAVLTNAIAALLETVGIDPFEDERAQKLARRFPDALRQVAALHEGLAEDSGLSRAEAAPDPGGAQPAA